MKPRNSAHSIICVFLLLSLFVVSCNPVASPSLSLPVLTPQPGTPLPDWLQVYFTDPTAPNARSYEGGPDEALAAAIDRAKLSVDMAVYNLNLWSIRDALVDAFHRGVNVRVVAESDNMDGQEFQDLIDAGIPVIGDQHEGLMHDKFVIIDRAEVWTGSMNYTTNGAYLDDNNLVRIQSEQAAGIYTAEFEQMFSDDLFGPDKVSGSSSPGLTIGDTSVEVYFSPAGGVADRLIELIDHAQESVYFMAYSFTSNGIGAAIAARDEAGVRVAGVMDADQIVSNEGTEYDPFMQAGVDVRKDGNEGLMHHKVIIIDQKIVITGSYNFTNSAETRNDENVVIIFSPAVAALYIEEFQKVYAQAQP